MTYVRRRLQENVQYVGVWEWQKRGVLHRHFLVRVERPTTQKRVHAAVRNSARSFEFGSQVDVQAMSADGFARAVNYVAKYASKTVDSIDGHRLLDVRTGELKRSAGFRAWSSSREWGDTMKAVRERQCRYARATGSAGPAGTTVAGGEAALDPNSGSSTVDTVEGVELPRVSAPAVPL